MHVILIVVILAAFVAIYNLYNTFAEREVGTTPGIIIWLAVPSVSGWAVGSNFGDAYANAGAILTIGPMLAYCCYRPGNSPLRWMLLSGLKVPACIVATICLAVPAIRIGYAVLSGELKHEGWAGLPMEWLLSFLAPGLTAFLIILFVNKIRELGFRQEALEHHERESKANFEGHPNDWGTYSPNDADERSTANGGAGDDHDPWWVVLEVDPASGFAEIKRAARELLKKYHPDMLAEMPRFRAEAERETKRINRALQEAEAHFSERASN